MKLNFRKAMGFVAAAMACVMIGTAVPMTAQNAAQAEAPVQTVVVTSPFTAAVAQIRGSVVGVSNYQQVRYGNYGNYGNYGDWFGFGFGFGRGYGYGNGYDQQEPETREVEASTGSGVVIGPGYVLTNYHVVENANALKITVANEESENPETYDAVLVAYDENIDIAVVYAADLKLEPVQLGDSDSLQVGDWAICIGNPLGKQFSRTVTAGIVSALNRAVSSSSTDKYGRRETITNTMIQVDAAINSGNSGGGMFSVTGELMGIPTLKYTGSAYSGASVEGIGMCIPINAAKPLIENVLSGKIQPVTGDANQQDKGAESANEGLQMTEKPRMGISMTGLNTNHSAVRNGTIPNGVYVAEVEEGAPADLAGMKVGDIIVDVNGTVITSTTQVQQVVAGYKAGDTLNVKVYRIPGIEDLTSGSEVPDGEYIDLQVTLAVIPVNVQQ